MKSINILRFLLLSTTLSLVPFVAFSSTFTSDNPIVLPTTTTNEFLLPEVLDLDGKPLKSGEEYTIFSYLTGAGAVYLANIGNTKCPNAVVQHIVTPQDLGPDMPVKFFTKKQHVGDVVREVDDINIMFSIPTTRLCVNQTVWKVGDSEKGETRFVVTGGTLGNPGPETLNSWFKIEKYMGKFPIHKKNVYMLRHCPAQLLCPLCNINDCRDVDVTFDSGYYRLSITNEPSPFVFDKFKKEDA